MPSDEHELTERPTVEDVREAYRLYREAKSGYLDVLARYMTSRPADADPLFAMFVEDIPLLRVLHALSVGYGWSDAVYKVCARAQVAQAQLRGCITRDELHGGLVLTGKGFEELQRWTEYVVPLTEKHPRYRELWRAVTGLDDAP